MRSATAREKGHDLGTTRLLSGSGRSGTTWIQEMATADSNLRPIFEPFDARRDVRFGVLPFGRYIAPAEEAADVHSAVLPVLTGLYRSPWSDQLSTPRLGRRYRGRLIKDIRILCSVGWLAKSFPEVPVAHVVRHPFDVVHSGNALNWSVDRLDFLLEQASLEADHLSEQASALRKLREPWERAVALWAVENHVVFRTLPQAGARLVIYEEAVRDPSSLAPLWDHFRIPLSQVGDADRPSKMTRPGSHILSQGARVRPAPIDEEMRRSGSEVLALFGFDRAFASDGSVDASLLRALWKDRALSS
ncbi:sulfotransferase [Microbacterium sp. MTN4-12]